MESPTYLAIAGNRLYVASRIPRNNIAVIDTETDKVLGDSIPMENAGAITSMVEAGNEIFLTTYVGKYFVYRYPGGSF